MPKGPRSIPLTPLVQTWLSHKHAAQVATAEEKKLNARVSELVAKQGQADDKGHVWVRLDSDVSGFTSKGEPAVYNAVQRQRRVSVMMDEEEATKILEKHGILDECSRSYIEVTDVDAALKALADAGLLDADNGIEVRTEVVEEAVQAAFYERKLTPEEYDRIFIEKISYALLPGKL